MKKRLWIEGELYSGKGEGAFFTHLDWVRRQMQEKIGFDPYPGTVNIRVPTEELFFLKQLSAEGERLIPPDPQFCEARVMKAKIEGLPAAAIFPAEDVWIYKDSLELMAPTCIRDALKIRDGDIVKVELERSFEPRAVIFDLDGTIIDSFEVYCVGINETFRRVGLTEVSKETVKEVMRLGKNPWEVLMPQNLPDREALITKCKEIAEEFFLPLYRERARLFPEVMPVLEALYEKGLKLALVTSGWEEEGEIRELLKKGGVLGFLKEIVTRFDVVRQKPAPDPLIECCKRLGVHVWDSVYVGDALADIQMGKAAKAATVGVLTGVGTREDFLQEEADAIIEDLSGLISILEVR